MGQGQKIGPSESIVFRPGAGTLQLHQERLEGTAKIPDLRYIFFIECGYSVGSFHTLVNNQLSEIPVLPPVGGFQHLLKELPIRLNFAWGKTWGFEFHIKREHARF